MNGKIMTKLFTRIVSALCAVILLAVMAGCGAREESADMSLFSVAKTVGKDIPVSDITDFYYSKENYSAGYIPYYY